MATARSVHSRLWPVTRKPLLSVASLLQLGTHDSSKCPIQAMSVGSMAKEGLFVPQSQACFVMFAAYTPAPVGCRQM